MDNYIKRFFDQEIWKQVEIKAPFSERYDLYISNYGKLKRIAKDTLVEKILRQGLTEGYPTSSFSIYLPMSEKENLKFIGYRQEINQFKNQINELQLSLTQAKLSKIAKKEISDNILSTQSLLNRSEASYIKKYRKCELKRKQTIYFLVHRVIALHFLKQPSENHNLVAHLDFDKLNNHHSNLQWMTREENVAHQKNSPFVIKSKIEAVNNPLPKFSKLTVNQVMILKKRLQEDGVILSKLAKRYKVSETQLLRIKRGENWAKIPAAL